MAVPRVKGAVKEMQLKSVRVQNYRCVLDSNVFELDRVTCLVGKNESGKTTLLQALRELNPLDNPRRYNKDLDYPRAHVNQYAERHGGQEAEVLTTIWTLDDGDVAAVETSLGQGVLSSHEITLKKRYGDERFTWTLSIDEKKVLETLAAAALVKGDAKKQLEKFSYTEDAVAHIDSLGGEQTAELKTLAAAIKKFPNNSGLLAAIHILAPRVPKLLYFGAYDQMSGKVALEQLQQQVANGTLTQGHRVFMAFLEFAGIPLAEIPNLQSFETLIARLEGASNAISEQIFDYWSQNQFLRVVFMQVMGMAADAPPFNNGWILRTRVYNELHKVTVDFDERSTGFVWFFSFLALLSQVKKQHGNLVILLDEPGLSLHGKAQADLLRYIEEKLRPEHQVIYTTHSPFMVPPTKLTSVRTVEDVVELREGKRPVSHGTKVRADVLATDRDTVFPLQGALGYEITQTLFVGKNTLLVEGPGDVLMFQSASAKLKALGRTGLSDAWTLCPVGGIGKVMPFVNLFGGGNKLNVAVVADYALKDKQEVERLRASELLRQDSVFTAEAFTNQPEADTEDFFGPSLYAAIVNQAYKLKGKNAITSQSIADVQIKTPRVVKRVEALFAAMPQSVPEFDHYTPAYWLQQHPETLDETSADVQACLARFEALFAAVNTLPTE